jgi:LAGLIDADG DNA endonuclease family protein
MKWSSDLAYVVGLITTDGSLSNDGRHINLTSKDKEQIETFASILHLNNKIGLKVGGFKPNGVYYQIQFGNISFYNFLLSIGLTPNKTKTLGYLIIPDEYFVDFLRGHLDGDGYTFSYWDKRWKNSFMLYTGFISASRLHLDWINEKINHLYQIEGRIKYAGKSVFHLVYAKKASIFLLDKIYYSKAVPCLSRKRFKIERSLDIIYKRGCAEMVYRHA